MKHERFGRSKSQTVSLSYTSRIHFCICFSSDVKIYNTECMYLQNATSKMSEKKHAI